MSTTGISHNGSAVVDLARIKSIKIIKIDENKYNLSFELNGRIEYFQHPQTHLWEKEVIHEDVRVEFDDYDMANAYLKDWAECWKDFKLDV